MEEDKSKTKKKKTLSLEEVLKNHLKEFGEFLKKEHAPPFIPCYGEIQKFKEKPTKFGAKIIFDTYFGYISVSGQILGNIKENFQGEFSGNLFSELEKEIFTILENDYLLRFSKSLIKLQNNLFSFEKLIEIYHILHHPTSGIKTKDRKVFGKTFKSADFIECLLRNNIVESRDKAILVGKQMIELQLIENATFGIIEKGNDFKDQVLFLYKFLLPIAAPTREEVGLEEFLTSVKSTSDLIDDNELQPKIISKTKHIDRRTSKSRAIKKSKEITQVDVQVDENSEGASPVSLPELDSAEGSPQKLCTSPAKGKWLEAKLNQAKDKFDSTIKKSRSASKNISLTRTSSIKQLTNPKLIKTQDPPDDEQQNAKIKEPASSAPVLPTIQEDKWLSISFNDLIQNLVHLRTDPEDIYAFLLTYRTFSTSEQVLQDLLQLFKEKAESRLKILRLITMWTEEFWRDWENEDLFPIWEEFCKFTENNVTYLGQFVEGISKKMKNLRYPDKKVIEKIELNFPPAMYPTSDGNFLFLKKGKMEF